MIDILPMGYVHTPATYPITETPLVHVSAGTTSVPSSHFSIQNLLDYVRIKILNDEVKNKWSAYALTQWGDAKEQTNSLGRLHDNWDGYGALSIEKTVLANTIKFLDILANWQPSIPVPEIIPMTNGTISLVWESDLLDAALEIGNTRYSGYVRKSSQAPSFFEGRADTESITDNFFASSIADAAQPFTSSFTSTVILMKLSDY